MAVDPYKVLGVASSASEDDIRKAYRAIAKKYHPDRNPDDAKAAERFKQASAAFDILKDKDKRARYDRGEIDADGNERGPQGFRYQQRPGGPFGGAAGGGAAGGAGFEDISDLFSDLFGGRGGGGGGRGFAAKGEDFKYELAVDFMDAVCGEKKRVTMPDGRTLDIGLPEGVEDGQTLRLRGQGGQGRSGGPAGDVLVEIKVKPHALFERKGDDIYLDAPISLSEAVLGGKITIPTISGSVSVGVPKGSSSGATLRLKGKGIQKKGKPAGDQYVRLKIALPDKPDKALEEFVKGWKAGGAHNPRKDLEAM